MSNGTNSEDNTPPRSPDHLLLDEDDIIEVIEIDDDFDEDADDLDEDMEELVSDEDDSDSKPERDDAFATFQYHTSSVLSCAFHPVISSIIATGGMDDKVVVWDCCEAECKILMEYVPEQNLESIDCVKFSPDGNFLAACDLNGNVHLFNCCDDYKHFADIDLEDDFKCFIWHQSNRVFIVITSIYVTMHKIPDMDKKLIATCTDGNFTCGKLFPDGKRIAVATNKGSVRVIDLKTTEVLSSAVVKSDSNNSVCDIYCMDIHLDGNTIVCGSDYGTISLVNAENGKVSYLFTSDEEYQDVEAIECGKSQQTKNLAVSCHRSGHIRFWDLSRMALRCDYYSSTPVTSLRLHPTSHYVFTSHANGKILMSDVRSGTVVREFLGHLPMILSMDVSNDGTLLVSTSDDRSARVFPITDVKL